MAEFAGDFGARETSMFFGNPAESSTVSLWMQTAERGESRSEFPSLIDDIEADVAIVGAGITGMTLAILLQQAGFDVAVIDAHPVGYGVSGFNSGHLTTMLLDMEYKSIIAHFGEEATRKIAVALEGTLDLVERNSADFRIDCNFQRIPGYLYVEHAEDDQQKQELKEEFESAAKAGLTVQRTHRVPLPFSTAEGILVANQARFHPLKYVQGLARAFVANGGRIYENSRVEDVQHPSDKESGFEVKTGGGVIRCDEVVLATHTPIGFRPAIQTRLEVFRSYVIGVRTEDPVEDALYWDMEDPYHYIRLGWDEQGPLLVIGGEDHKTGEKRETAECFRRLEDYAHEHFIVSSVDYHWSAQLYNPADGLPYIGKLSDVYIATGYSGEGLTFGTLAAQVIADLIQGRQNDCADILTPTRAKPIASAGGFISENLGTLAHFVGDRLRKGNKTDPNEVPVGEGRICDMGGKQAAVYHSDEGVLHVMSPVCTHMGCIVNWNEVEKSWDCPCHGGRFDATGHVLNGPPTRDLDPLEFEE